VVVGFVVLQIAPEATFAAATAAGLCLAGVAALALALALTYVPAAPRIAARQIAWPVRGRWLVVNGPGSSTPSHGTHAHGQTFAIDFVPEPSDGSRPAFGAGSGFLRPQAFPGFGAELLAPVDGRVVAVRDRARDHRSRSTWSAMAYMYLEGMFREMLGSKLALGNFVILDADGGAYALLAHLQRGSVTVQAGQTVQRGEVLGLCGNSGNSSEPHLHFQLMDHPRPLIAAGMPFKFTGLDPEVAGRDGVPANEEVLVVSADGTAVPSAS
jgi:hypothetical protein